MLCHASWKVVGGQRSVWLASSFFRRPSSCYSPQISCRPRFTLTSFHAICQPTFARNLLRCTINSLPPHSPFIIGPLSARGREFSDAISLWVSLPCAATSWRPASISSGARRCRASPCHSSPSLIPPFKERAREPEGPPLLASLIFAARHLLGSPLPEEICHLSTESSNFSLTSSFCHFVKDST